MLTIDTIEKIRKKNKCSISKLCRGSGVSRDKYYRWLRGREPGVTEFNKMIDYFGLKIVIVWEYQE